MKEKLNLLRGVYFVTHGELSEVSGRTIYDDVSSALDGGATIIQYREKQMNATGLYQQAARIKRLVGDRALFIVNDDVTLAKEVGADGVHLGQKDLLKCSLSEAREIVGDSMVIGVSVGSYDEAIKAQSGGADYLGVSPVFDTTTKPDAGDGVGVELLEKIAKGIDLPIVAIGGINNTNFDCIVNTGVDSIAMITALHNGDVAQRVRYFSEKFNV